jgi:hypothetical protein
MDGYQAYKYFIALKLHFTTEKFDVFSNNGRVNASRVAYERRNDKALFERLSRKYPTDRELIQYMAANFAYGNKHVVYSYESDEYYNVWLKRKESISQVFKTDLLLIQQECSGSKESVFSIDDGNPLLLNLYLGNHITLETMVILEELEGYLSKWEPLIMFWHDHFLTIRKSKRFVKFDKNKVQSIYDNFVAELVGEEV